MKPVPAIDLPGRHCTSWQARHKVHGSDVAYCRRYRIPGNRRLRARPGTGNIETRSTRKRRRRRGWGRDATAGVMYTRQLPILPLTIMIITILTNW